MDLRVYKNKIRTEVVIPLKEYKKECGKDSGYNIFHILACKNILVKYIKRLNAIYHLSDDKILNAVKEAVLSLNRLNEKTDYCLIETFARESIWEIIQGGAKERGLKSDSEDLTEQWREW